MAGQHWSDIAKRRHAATRTAAPQTIAGAPRPSAEAVAASNPTLAALMAERRALEQRMRSATGGAPGADPRDALRFQVPSMAERRAEFGDWSGRRDAQSLAALQNLPPADVPPPLERRPAAPRPAAGVPDPSLRETRGERPGGTPVSADDWLAARLGIERPRRGRVADDGKAWLEKRLGGGSVADKAAEFGRSLDSAASDLDRQFDDADRKLASEGASEEDRREIARLKKDLGLDNYTKARDKARDKGDDVIARATALPDAFRGAERKVEDDWLSRRDAIGGEDKQSYMKPLRALNDRVLGMGMPDIEERSAAGRAMALDRRKAAREEAQADDARRERALERRRMARDGV
ncbi:MAG: hypothetical protein V4574_09155 [Pseudomonadota bacterium]